MSTEINSDGSYYMIKAITKKVQKVNPD